MSIHPTAIISPGAQIGPDCQIGAYSVIGPKVKLGRGNLIGPHVVIEGNTSIGDDNQIFQFASVGSRPQDLKFKGEESSLSIGHGNMIREFVTLQPGTSGGGLCTRIGNKNLFMANCHVGHDGVIGNENVFANSCALAGHVQVGNYVIVGGLSGIHQFARIGDFAFLAAGSMVAADIPPYCMVHGDRAKLVGINSIGLKRRGFTSEQILIIRRLYRDLFRGSGRLSERLKLARSKYGDGSPAHLFLSFIETSKRGLVSVRRKGSDVGSSGSD